MFRGNIYPKKRWKQGNFSREKFWKTIFLRNSEENHFQRGKNVQNIGSWNVFRACWGVYVHKLGRLAD
jgi:hypothetical protein